MRDERNGSSQTFLRDFTNVLVIDANGAFGHIVHAQQQAHKGGFAAPLGPTRPTRRPAGMVSSRL